MQTLFGVAHFKLQESIRYRSNLQQIDETLRFVVVIVVIFIKEGYLPIAWAKAITTSWQVVASVTPHTTLWTPSTQTLSSILGQKRGGEYISPNIIEGWSDVGQAETPPADSLQRKHEEKQEVVSQDVLKAKVTRFL